MQLNLLPMHSRIPFSLAVCFGLGLALVPDRAAYAWSIGSQLDNRGCHERITAEALRRVRMSLGTAPALTPTRDQAALIDAVQFAPPTDMVHDLAGMALLLGVRDNDLKGQNPLDTLNLVEVHGSHDTQQEHCIRSLTDDDNPGNVTALAACRAFIVQRATEALAGLDANGVVDPSVRMPLQIYASFAGSISPSLPLFYVRMGQAMHALEDGFTHTYRTADGIHPTVVLNYVEYVSGGSVDINRDGPNHRASLDHCDNPDPTIARNYKMAIEAATELLAVALDPARTREQKIAAFEVVNAKYLTYQESGCTHDNQWCDAIERKITDSGCNAGRGPAPWSFAVLLGLALFFVTRRRASHASLLLALSVSVSVSVSTSAQADDAPPAPAPAPAPKPVGDAKPAIKVEPKTVDDAKSARAGKEPGREEATPTIKEVKAVREDKRLGNKWGFAGSIGGSVDKGAGNLTAGLRYRISEKWITGIDAEWNPWITSVPIAAKAGAANLYATLIRRFPMRFDRVNLRTSLHLGVSTLLFDVPGAPKYSTGPYISFAPLGIDYDLGGSVRIVLDPVEIALPVPYVGLIPLYYEQFRLMIGLQIGA